MPVMQIEEHESLIILNQQKETQLDGRALNSSDPYSSTSSQICIGGELNRLQEEELKKKTRQVVSEKIKEDGCRALKYGIPQARKWAALK